MYDSRRGKYAVYLTKIDRATRTVDFDPIQFLVGAAAVTAWQHDNPGSTGGPPNDYYIVDADRSAVAARVADDVVVWQVRLEETSTADLKTGTFDGLVTYLAAHPTGSASISDRPFWLTLANGSITTICEQYVP